jgi:hypothetical protein
MNPLEMMGTNMVMSIMLGAGKIKRGEGTGMRRSDQLRLHNIYCASCGLIGSALNITNNLAQFNSLRKLW